MASKAGSSHPAGDHPPPSVSGGTDGAAVSSIETRFRHALQLAGALAQPQTLLIAFSGGLDSRVLLQFAAGLRPQARFRLRAMHVHHGLSANADDWAEF